MLNDASGGAMTIHHDDILRFGMSNMFPKEAVMPWDGSTPHIYLIGNLPFSISTPLIIKVSKHIRYFPCFYTQFEMVQFFGKIKIWFGFHCTSLLLNAKYLVKSRYFMIKTINWWSIYVLIVAETNIREDRALGVWPRGNDVNFPEGGWGTHGGGYE